MDILRKTFEIGSNEFDHCDFCVTKEITDRYGDVVAVKGVKYPQKIIALWNHGHDVPIGTWSNTRVAGDELRSRITFAPQGVSPKIDELRKLTEHGVINSCSIGFVPLDSQPIVTNGRQTGVRYTASEILEISLVSCPANAGAISLAKSLNVSDAILREVFDMTAGDTIGQRVRRARQAVAKAKAIMKKSSSPQTRATMAKIIAQLEQADREQVARYTGVKIASSREQQQKQREAALKVEAKRYCDELMRNYKPSEASVRAQFAIPPSYAPGDYEVPLFIGGKPIWPKKNKFGY